MRQSKDINACVTALQTIQASNDVEPEQRQDIKRALEQLKQLRRNPHASQKEVFRVVREITEALIRAFLKKK